MKWCMCKPYLYMFTTSHPCQHCVYKNGLSHLFIGLLANSKINKLRKADDSKGYNFYFFSRLATKFQNMKKYWVLTFGVACIIGSNHANRSQRCLFRWLSNMEQFWNILEKISEKIFSFFIILLCECLY
jgi:hypothetical protein